jgi:hypothetical protein
MLYSQADSKKKSNLMMSLFEPGPEPLPWLGKMAQLGPISGIMQTDLTYLTLLSLCCYECLSVVGALPSSLMWVHTRRTSECLRLELSCLGSGSEAGIVSFCALNGKPRVFPLCSQGSQTTQPSSFWRRFSLTSLALLLFLVCLFYLLSPL